MKTFTAPAWLKKQLSDGTFTYTPAPHPASGSDTLTVPPCSTSATVSDDTPFSADAWQMTTGADGAQIYTLAALDSDTMSAGVLISSQVAATDCTNNHCKGSCASRETPALSGGTLTSCGCSS